MQQRYSLIAITLHWLIAVLLAFQLAVGFGLEDLGPRGFALYQLHKSIGISILLLTLLRIGWRLVARRPAALEAGWQGALAGAVHVGLYLFMLGAPLTGWLMVSTDKVRVPTLLFGTLPWPHVPLPQRLNPLFDGAHSVLGWIGIALFALHVAGALRHQWLLRDPVMRRMSPGRSAWPVLFLALLLPVAWAIGLSMLNGAGERPAMAEQAKLQPPARPAEQPAPVANEAEAANAAAPAAPSPPPVWTIQPGGALTFSIDNGGARIDGRFAKWSGAITFDPDQLDSADIRISVDLASASVGDATQDEMLAGEDFFAIALQPQAVFRATAVRRTGPDRYAASGTLTLKGASKPQTVRFTLSGDGLSRHVEGSATIARAAFGIGKGQADATLAPEVMLRFRFDAKGKVGK